MTNNRNLLMKNKQSLFLEMRVLESLPLLPDFWFSSSFSFFHFLFVLKICFLFQGDDVSDVKPGLTMNFSYIGVQVNEEKKGKEGRIRLFTVLAG